MISESLWQGIIMDKTIQNMANSFDTCHSLGLNARAKAAKRHNPKNVAKELLESYHKIMNIYGNNKHT